MLGTLAACLRFRRQLGRCRRSALLNVGPRLAAGSPVDTVEAADAARFVPPVFSSSFSGARASSLLLRLSIFAEFASVTTMTQPVTMIRVFWSAPGDIADECAAFFETVSQWNDSHSAAQSAVLKPVAWKTDTFPTVGRPQAVINEQALEGSDILVAVFWSRFGTPTGQADSGTEEEIRQSVAAGRTVMLYFCEREIPPGAADAKQLRRLARFKAEFRRSALVQSYRETEDFRRAFAQHLALAVNMVLKRQRSDYVGTATPQTSIPQNVVSFSGGQNVGNVIHQTVVHKYTGKRKPPKGYPEGCIGADLPKRNYCRSLTKRYNEYREADPSYGRQTRFSYGFIGKRVEQVFGNPINLNPVETFEAICEFLKEYIDGTIQGKVNRKRGIPNYKTFDEFLAEQQALAQRGTKRRKSAE